MTFEERQTDPYRVLLPFDVIRQQSFGAIPDIAYFPAGAVFDLEIENDVMAVLSLENGPPGSIGQWPGGLSATEGSTGIPRLSI
jgi:hypothetical protein